MTNERINILPKTNNIMHIKHDYSGLKPASRQGILWPCLSYKVLLPMRVNKNTNIFEETILKLAELGIVETERVAEETCLHSEIVSFIQRRLHQINYLDSRNRLSEEGLKQLDYWRSQLNDPTKLVSCIVYLDVINDVLLPFVHFGREKYEVVKDVYPASKEGFRNISFSHGSAGREKLINAKQLLNTENIQARTIEVEELIVSLKKYMRLAKQYAVFSKIDSYDIPRIPKANAITIDQQPVLTYLYCEAFVQEGNPNIFVTNGFGVGYSSQFKSYLLKRNYTWLVTLKENAVEHTVKEIYRQFKPEPDHDASLEGSLEKSLKNANWRMNTIKNNVAKTDSESNLILDTKNDLMNELYGIIESVFRLVIFEFPADHWRKVFISSASQYGTELLVGFAEGLGLNVTRENSHILNVIPGKVRAIEEGTYEMRALLSLIIAGAHENNRHPFRRLLKSMYTITETSFANDNILTSISRLKVFRDTVSHGKKIEGIPDEECRKYHNLVKKIVKHLLPGKLIDMDISKAQGKAFIDINQIRLIARIAIDKYFGLPLVVGMSNDLFQELISISMKEQIDNFENNIARDYVNSLASVLQTTFQGASLCYSFAASNEKTDYKSLALAKLEVVLSKAGIGGLNQSSVIRTINPRKVKNAVSKGNTTLGGSFLAFCLLLPESALTLLFKQIPGIEQVVSRIHEVRGHGNYSGEFPTRKELVELKNNTYSIVKKVLEI